MSVALASVPAEVEAVEDAAVRRCRDRYEARNLLWRISKLGRRVDEQGRNIAGPLQQCGRHTRGQVSVRVGVDSDGERQPSLTGLMHCSSVWACPVCSARINDHRSKVLAEALHRWDSQGGKVCMVTLTVRHDRHHSLASVWEAVSAAWTAATSGGTWVDAQDQFGAVPVTRWKTKQRDYVKYKVPVEGYAIPWWRVFEVTHGVNGWHVHVHALLLVGGDFTDTDAASLGSIMWKRWDGAAQRAGLPAGQMLTDDGRPLGLDARVVKGDPSHVLGYYFSKAVYELTGSRFKTGKVRGEHRAPFGILADLVRDGQAGKQLLTPAQRRRLLALWYEWEETSRGHLQMGRSRGLLELLGMTDWKPAGSALGADATDDAIVDSDELRTSPVTWVYDVPDDIWRTVCRRGLDYHLWAAFRHSDWAGLQFLRSLGASWSGDVPDGAHPGRWRGQVEPGPDDWVRRLAARDRGPGREGSLPAEGEPTYIEGAVILEFRCVPVLPAGVCCVWRGRDGEYCGELAAGPAVFCADHQPPGAQPR